MQVYIDKFRFRGCINDASFGVKMLNLATFVSLGTIIMVDDSESHSSTLVSSSSFASESVGHRPVRFPKYQLRMYLII